MVEKTITIAIDANIQKFKKAMSEARASVAKTGSKVKEDSKSMSEGLKESTKSGGLTSFADSIKGISPTLDGVIDGISDMKDRMQKAGKAGKLAMMGVKVAVGGLALGLVTVLGKAIMDMTGKLAKMADPVRFDMAMSEMKESIRKLKTSLGELMAPVFEAMTKGVKALADGLTWVVEKVAQFVGFLQGLLNIGHKVNQTLKGTSDEMKKAGESADAGLASFDKLTSLNFEGMGDAEQAEKMVDIMDKARKAGEESAKAIHNIFEPILALLDMDVGDIWEKFKQSAIDAWNAVKDWAHRKWQEIKDTIKGTWSGMVEWASEAWESIKESAREIWEKISSWASGLWDDFVEWASDAWENIKTKAHETWDDIKNWVVEKFTGIGKAISEMFQGVVDAFRKAWDKAFGAISGAVKWVIKKIEWLLEKIDGIKNSMKGIGEKLGGVGQGVKDWFGRRAEDIKGVFGFAKGGVFQPNSPQLVMVGDNKSEPEVIAPRSMIMDAMRQVISEMGAGGRDDRPITLQIDGRTFARFVYDDLDAEGRRRGMRA